MALVAAGAAASLAATTISASANAAPSPADKALIAAAAVDAAPAWTSVDDGQTASQDAAFAYDPLTKTSVMFGGSTGTTDSSTDTTETLTVETTDETWSWDGATWAQAHPAAGPSARFSSSMVFDPASSQLVLFGGGNESVTFDDDAGTISAALSVDADTWVWTGSAWSPLSPATSPPGRAAASAAYDPTTKQIILFGGGDATGGVLADTWAWNGVTWAQLTPATSPPARADASLAYDSTSGKLILFGGTDADGVTLGDTWAWDGATWTPLTSPNTPPSRAGAVMVDDPDLGGVVLVGGMGADVSDLAGAWVWKGSDWTALTVAGAPPAIRSAAATFDAQRGQIVVVGGSDDDGDAVSTTWLLTAKPAGPAAIDRVSGATRIATAIAVADEEFTAGSAKAVVLARSDAFPDALAGGPLAAHVGGPLLLTAPGTLDTTTEAEVQKLLPAGGTVYLLGGTAGLSAGIDTALQGLGYQTKRLAGDDRFGTATAVADEMGDPTTVFEASGLNFADALAGVPAAISTGGAILLTNGSSQSKAASGYLAAHPPAKKYALGGPAAAADPNATPLVGADRYATAALVASTFFPAPTVVGFATGLNYPDALAAGVLLGSQGGPLLLTPTTGALPSSVGSYLAAAKATITAAYAFGGTASLGADVVAEAQQAIGQPTTP